MSNILNKGLSEKVLFDGEADDYAAIINDYPICHDDCVKILKTAARLKSVGYSNEQIIERMTHRLS